MERCKEGQKIRRSNFKTAQDCQNDSTLVTHLHMRCSCLFLLQALLAAHHWCAIFHDTCIKEFLLLILVTANDTCMTGKAAYTIGNRINSTNEVS